ncbi:MAG: glycosyltransferase [Sandaracinobacteroides sp.]
MLAVLLFLVLVQVALAVALLPAFGRVVGNRRIPVSTAPAPFAISVIVPVLNEEQRLAPMLGALLAEAQQVPEIREILVVDGGSTDGTQGIVQSFQAQDPRLKFVDVSPVPLDAVGKAWGLMQGAARASGDWLLTLDADTLVAPGLTRSLAAFAKAEQLDALSIATRQACPGWLQSMLHPAFLTTLVYRFGPPGYATRDPRRVMANGQCFFASRAALDASNALRLSLASLCEDVTIARTLAGAGFAVGFFETDVPVEVQMYASAREVWANWPRSLVMRDGHSSPLAVGPFAQLILLQAAPLPLLAAALIFGLPGWFLLVQAGLCLFRLGVLFGISGSYRKHAPSFWLSPLLDLPVILRLLQAQFQRRLAWRGRIYARSRDGTIRAMPD